MGWYAAPCLLVLRAEINKKWPNRDHASDGILGDANHSARVSDHNPDSRGMVHAMDIDKDGIDVKWLLKELIGDPRVWYVIHKLPGQPSYIWSRTNGWRPKLYFGANPHDHHIHVSVRYDTTYEYSTAPWFTDNSTQTNPKPKPTKPVLVSVSKARVQFLAARDGKKVTKSIDVKRIQRALNAFYGAGLKEDGIVGERTLNQYGRFETHAGIIGAPRIPDFIPLVKLTKGRFKVVK